jgi:hypothetical protein
MLHYAGANYGEVSFTAAGEFRAKCSGKFLMVRSAAEKLKLRVVFTFEDWGIGVRSLRELRLIGTFAPK